MAQGDPYDIADKVGHQTFQYEKRVEELKQKIAQTDKRNAEIQAESRRLKTSSAQLKQSIEAKKAQTKAYKAATAKARLRAEQLGKIKDEVHRRLAMQERGVGLLKSSLESDKKESEAMKGQIQSAKEKFEEEMALLDCKKGEIIGRQKMMLEEHELNKASWQSDIDKLTSELAQAKAESIEKSEKIKKEEERISQLRQEESRFRKEIRGTDLEIAKRHQSSKIFAQNVAQDKQLLSAIRATIAKLELEEKIARVQRDEKMIEKEALEENAVHLEKAKVDFDTKMEENEKKLEQSVSKNAKLMEDIEHMKNVPQTFKSSKMKKSKEAMEVEEMQKRVDAMPTDDEMGQKFSQIMASVSDLKQTRNRLAIQLSRKTPNDEGLSEKDLSKKLQSVMDEEQSLDREIMDMEEEIDTMEKKIGDAIKAKSKKSKDVELLKQEVGMKEKQVEINSSLQAKKKLLDAELLEGKQELAQLKKDYARVMSGENDGKSQEKIRGLEKRFASKEDANKVLERDIKKNELDIRVLKAEIACATPKTAAPTLQVQPRNNIRRQRRNLLSTSPSPPKKTINRRRPTKRFESSGSDSEELFPRF